MFCLVGTGRSGGQQVPRYILAYLLGISRYLLGTLTSNLRFRSQGWGGVVSGSEKVKHIGCPKNNFLPS